MTSVDALRGFDMFWIIGADELAYSLGRISDSPAARLLAEQLEHVAWEGFRFYDLIFPLFIFIMGVSSVFSLSRVVAGQGMRAAHVRLLRRAAILFALGVFYYGARSRGDGPEMFRYVGVLQRIAFCYFFGGLAYLHLRWRGLLALCVAILVGYWVLLAFVPVPGIGAGNFAEGKNWANVFDQWFLPGYTWDGDWDPEGLLSTPAAVVTAILGIFAGMILQNVSLPNSRRVGYLALAGVTGLVLGWMWGWHLPIIKKIWTSSYVLFAGGWSYLLLALFYLVIDVWKFDLWARPFVWIGMNSIAIYMLAELLNFRSLVRRVIHQPLVDAMSPCGDLVVSVMALSLAVGICYFLYRRKIFVRV
jgi:predicted acyltransferase